MQRGSSPLLLPDASGPSSAGAAASRSLCTQTPPLGMQALTTTQHDRGAALLVYDIADRDTSVQVRKWVKELQQMAPKNIVMAIAANKSELVRSKKFDFEKLKG
ncbi:ras-related protein Rab-5C-like [Phoenix dactylifera]|uniref:Ras-related protein Rab-5C-like n=1 Tax=Phoenix dactylifera TaxID=42345 RepID=A0A8B9ARL8_PHODC|nr:ras-related protein Rab-5C-like [Phoenix dactylifera]